jgi:endonuclease/exonuclease/phosphatase family metal-dependent hydrolase
MMIKAKSTLSYFDKFVLFFNYIAAVSILISYLSPITNPKNFWPVAFFGLAYPELLLLNVLFALFWAFRFKIHFLLSVICIAVGWNILQNNIGFHKTTVTDAPKAKPEQIRVMAYNVHSFINAQNNSTSIRHQVLQIIKDQQPDIINLEEFHSQAKGRSAVCDSIKKVLQTEYAYFQPFSGTLLNGNGLAIISKYPIINQGIIRLTEDGSDTNAIYVDVNINGKIVRIYCVHLQSFLLNAKDHGYVDSVSQKGKADMRSSRRIGGKLKIAFIRRSEQVSIMKSNMEKCPYPYILAGDFNDTPSSYAVNQMAKGIKNAFREQGRGLCKTYNGDVPNYQIDYILASPQFDVMNYTVIEKKLSDHYPVRSDLVMK